MKPSLTQNRKAWANDTLRPPDLLFSAAGALLSGIVAGSFFTMLPGLRTSIQRAGSSLVQAMQAIEDRTGLFDKLTVVVEQFGQASNSGGKSGSFQASELTVLEVNVVDDLGDCNETRVTGQAKALDHGFDGAIFALVGELASIHI